MKTVKTSQMRGVRREREGSMRLSARQAQIVRILSRERGGRPIHWTICPAPWVFPSVRSITMSMRSMIAFPALAWAACGS